MANSKKYQKSFRKLMITLLIISLLASPVYAAEKFYVIPDTLTMSPGEVEFITVYGLKGFPEDYKSSNSAVVKIEMDQYGYDSYRIEAVGEGTAKISFLRLDYNESTQKSENVFAECEVIVVGKKSTAVESEADGAIKVTGIKVAPKTLEISVEQSFNINVQVVPVNATEKRYSWSVDNGDVIDIKTNGRITGKSPGVVRVTAVSLEGQFQDTCIVTVKEAETDIVSKESQKPESTTPMKPEAEDTSVDMIGKDPLAGIITEDTRESIKEIKETLNDKIKDLNTNELFDNLKSYEDDLVEKRLEKSLEPEDAARKKAGMEIFKNAKKTEEKEVQEKNKRSEKTTERLKKIAEKQGYKLEKVEDTNGLIKLEIKDEGQMNVSNELVYNLKTEHADKLIDKVLDKTIGALVKKLIKKKLMPDLLETGMGLFGRFFKDKKDELILTDDEQIQKVREEIGVSDDVSAELYLRNNQWSEKETAAGTWTDLFTINKSAEKFNKVLEEIVSLRKKDHANASKLEYELINREVNRLRMDGLPKDEAVKVIKNRYVYEYYDHYGLETKKSDGTWQDNVLQFLGLGGENRRFGGFNKDKMDVSSSEGYKDTGTRFDMIIEVMDSREDIYTDDDVLFIRKLRQEEGRE